MSNRPGIRLFRLFGIEVSLHWLWFVLAIYEINNRRGSYGSIAWNIAEYVSLFLIVLMHEFGHALACRSVGGIADHIMLWPLGGVAFVRPPPRPGAHLWSIAAGPLVNVVLLPVTLGLFWWINRQPAWVESDLWYYLRIVAIINIVLLVFNLLPIYPLDGGQILRSVLWFFIGPARSLLVASVIGLLGGAAVMVLAIWLQDVWLIILAVFGAIQSYNGFRYARMLKTLHALPVHAEARCPSCAQHPPAADLWRCDCGRSFDPFASNAACPACGSVHRETACPHCGTSSPFFLWLAAPAPVVSPAAGKQ